MPDRDQAHRLIRERIEERSLLRILLFVLDGDIDVRRELERFEKLPFVQRDSVRVERTREELQARLAEIDQEIDSLLNLLEKIARQTDG